MKIIGIDLTSRPNRHKPITALHCLLEDNTLIVDHLREWQKFCEFEHALSLSGPWVVGIVFPFGQARRFIKTIGWPTEGSDYVRYANSLGRAGFRETLDNYRRDRRAGDKEHRRTTVIAFGCHNSPCIIGRSTKNCGRELSRCNRQAIGKSPQLQE